MRIVIVVAAATFVLAFAGTAAAQEHPSVKVGSGLKLDFTARLDSDARLATPAIGMDGPDFNFDRRRIGVDGSLFKKMNFQVERDLATDGIWRDVFINLESTKSFEIRAGRFKIPFGLEALESGSRIDFVRRALISTQLAPGRDTGVMAHGRLLGRTVRYSAGVFGGGGDNSRTSATEGAGRTIATRVVFSPFSKSSSGTDGTLQLGMGLTNDELTDVLGLRGRTAFSDGVFFDRVYVNGTRRRYGFDASWQRGPVSVASEYIAVTDQRAGMGADGDTLDPVHAAGWYLSGTWAMTGEQKSGRLEPQRGFGAIELVARVERLRFGPVALPIGTEIAANADRVTTAGLNWYLNRYLRMQSNLVIEAVGDPQRSPAPSNNGKFIGAVFRLQFTL